MVTRKRPGIRLRNVRSSGTSKGIRLRKLNSSSTTRRRRYGGRKTVR